MSERIGMVDVVSKSVTTEPNQIGGGRVTTSTVTEPRIWPHEIQELKSGEIVAVYRGETWHGEATPYFRMWPEMIRKA